MNEIWKDIILLASGFLWGLSLGNLLWTLKTNPKPPKKIGAQTPEYRKPSPPKAPTPSPKSLNAEKEEAKSCENCWHYDPFKVPHGRCVTCKKTELRNWEPVGSKPCETCKHLARKGRGGPCQDCQNFDEWEAQP